ncbi:hypothetical protein B0T19DRAFT_254474 [Cercophora scortea]|uniref:Uncharacterized protein n=1 Tax=Cercophora scortea TaxID=314031 RepID=A0AAE0I9K0_9PEZI|nr:hypothetical protein B0T19DRAFT_254474 [Cercophora scortea]
MLRGFITTYLPGRGGFNDPSSWTFLKARCPQINGYDSGVYTVAVAFHLAAGIQLDHTIDCVLWRYLLLSLALDRPFDSVLPKSILAADTSLAASPPTMDEDLADLGFEGSKILRRAAVQHKLEIKTYEDRMVEVEDRSDALGRLRQVAGKFDGSRRALRKQFEDVTTFFALLDKMTVAYVEGADMDALRIKSAAILREKRHKIELLDKYSSRWARLSKDLAKAEEMLELSIETLRTHLSSVEEEWSWALNLALD